MNERIILFLAALLLTLSTAACELAGDSGALGSSPKTSCDEQDNGECVCDGSSEDGKPDIATDTPSEPVDDSGDDTGTGGLTSPCDNGDPYAVCLPEGHSGNKVGVEHCPDGVMPHNASGEPHDSLIPLEQIPVECETGERCCFRKHCPAGCVMFCLYRPQDPNFTAVMPDHPDWADSVTCPGTGGVELWQIPGY